MVLGSTKSRMHVVMINMVYFSSALTMSDFYFANCLHLGNKFHLGHLTRAICCRVMDEINRELPATFCLRHPMVGRVNVYRPIVGATKACQILSVNWCAEDPLPEVINTLKGRSSDW